MGKWKASTKIRKDLEREVKQYSDLTKPENHPFFHDNEFRFPVFVNTRQLMQIMNVEVSRGKQIAYAQMLEYIKEEQAEA